MQSATPLWSQLRELRITASKMHDIFIRSKDPESLVKRMKNPDTRQTKAMKEGKADEPRAALKYSEVTGLECNSLPCFIVISVTCPWLAANPDRKIYCPNRVSLFGLLEIKCPRVSSVLKRDYLTKDGHSLKLKRHHSYYTQIQG